MCSGKLARKLDDKYNYVTCHHSIFRDFICLFVVVVVLGFYVPPTAKVIRRQDLGLSERLEKPGIEVCLFGLRLYVPVNNFSVFYQYFKGGKCSRVNVTCSRIQHGDWPE